MTDEPINVHVDTEGLDRNLRRITVALTDLRPFWPRVTRLFVGWMRIQFDSEGAFFGEGQPWTPLAPATVKRKEALGLRLQILQATGQSKQAASRPQRVARPQSLTLIIDDDGEKHGPVLQYHQEGNAHLPRRPVVPDLEKGERLSAIADLELQHEAEGYVFDFLRRL